MYMYKLAAKLLLTKQTDYVIKARFFQATAEHLVHKVIVRHYLPQSVLHCMLDYKHQNFPNFTVILVGLK